MYEPQLKQYILQMGWHASCVACQRWRWADLFRCSFTPMCVWDPLISLRWTGRTVFPECAETLPALGGKHVCVLTHECRTDKDSTAALVWFYFPVWGLNDRVVADLQKLTGLSPYWALMSPHCHCTGRPAFVTAWSRGEHVKTSNLVLHSGWNVSQLGQTDLARPSDTEPGESVVRWGGPCARKLLGRMIRLNLCCFKVGHSSSPTVWAAAWVFILKWVVISDRSAGLAVLRLWSASQEKVKSFLWHSEQFSAVAFLLL